MDGVAGAALASFVHEFASMHPPDDANDQNEALSNNPCWIHQLDDSNVQQDEAPSVNPCWIHQRDDSDESDDDCHRGMATTWQPDNESGTQRKPQCFHPSFENNFNNI
jgi:hypothetical protein